MVAAGCFLGDELPIVCQSKRATNSLSFDNSLHIWDIASIPSPQLKSVRRDPPILVRPEEDSAREMFKPFASKIAKRVDLTWSSLQFNPKGIRSKYTVDLSCAR